MDEQQAIHYAENLISKLEALENTGNGAIIHTIRTASSMLRSRIRNVQRAPYEKTMGVPTERGMIYCDENGKETITKRTALNDLLSEIQIAENVIVKVTVT